MSKVMNIGARIHSTEVGNVITGANEILDDTKHKKQDVINSEVDAELVRLDQAKQNVITFDNTPTEGSNNPVKSDGVFAADKALSDAIEAILLLIPSAATALNQLADKNFVNSSISTATASFKGTYNLVSDLGLAVDSTRSEIAEALASVIDTADENDYAFVQIPVSSDNPTEIQSTERYKFNGSAWSYEYTLNTSGFTAAQWDAINSGITQALVTKLGALPTASELAESLNGLSDEINDIKDVIPEEATALNQLADKAYVLTQILAATPAFKGQFTTLTELEAVTGAKTGDLGIVRTKDHDGRDVFTFYQYLNAQWNEYYTLSYHPITKPATTGVFGNYPFNGMGRIELPMNMVKGAWTDNTWVYYPVNGVVYLLYSWHLQLYAVYNSGTQEGLGLDDNLVVKDANYNINDIAEIVGERYLTFTESSGVYTITKPDTSTITSTELNNTTIYNFNDPSHEGVNVLTQAMLTQTNTIYEIKYDFDLNNQSVTIPANCVLYFQGGHLSNGTVIGQSTQFDGEKVGIFTNITIQGSWIVPVICSSLFTDAENDNLKNVFALTNAAIHNTVNIESGNYSVSAEDAVGAKAITVNSNTDVNLNGNVHLTPFYGSSGLTYGYYIFLLLGDNITLTGTGTIYGDLETSESKETEYGHGVYISGNNVVVDNVSVKDCYGDAIYIRGENSNYYIQNVSIENFRRNGISVTKCNNGIIENCVIKDGGTKSPRAAIDIEPNENDSIGSIKINNCVFNNTPTGLQVLSSASGSSIEQLLLCNLSFSSNGNPIGINGNSSSYIKNVLLSNIVVSGQTTETSSALSASYINNLTLNNSTITGNNKTYTININWVKKHVIENCKLSGTFNYLFNIIENGVIRNSDISCINFAGTILNSMIEGCSINGYMKPVSFSKSVVRDNIFFINKNYSLYADFSSFLEIRENSTSTYKNMYNSIQGNLFKMDFTNYTDTSKTIPAIIINTSRNIITENVIDNTGGGAVQSLGGIGFTSSSTYNFAINNTFLNFSTINRRYVDNSARKNIIHSFLLNTGGDANIPYINNTYYDSGAQGFMFFHNDRHKPIFWDTNHWVDATGINEETKRSGTKAQRPAGSAIYVGFQYMQIDTTNGTYPIWASAINGDTVTWVDATGATV